MQKRIRVLISDDHLLFRLGLKSLLSGEPNIAVAGESSTGRQTVEQCRKLKPDVVLLDLRMPEGGGIEALRTISSELPEIRILVLSSYANEEEIYKALDAGALGYVLKDVGREPLIEAIRTVAGGRRSVPEWIERIMRERSSRPDLTPREHEILRLLVTGLTNREIAHVMGNSENTVRNHTISIFAKLDVSDRAEAVSAALQRAIVIPAEDK
jgi:two-component system NarL family response regulator